MLIDPLPIQPFTHPVAGSLKLPGSKSITNRALVLAALSDGPVELEGALFSRDTRILCAALRSLGYAVDTNESESRIRVVGQGGRIPVAKASFNVGNAGTAARFLPALLALHPSGEFELDGDREMHRRPMAGLLEALEVQGCKFEFAGERGFYPFRMSTCGLRGGTLKVDARASSQMLSALMMVAPFAGETLKLHSPGVRPAFVEMTARMMEQFGYRGCGMDDNGYIVTQTATPYSVSSQRYTVEPDATAASYFLALTQVVGGELELLGMPENSLQGDVAFVEVMRSLGLEVEIAGGSWLLKSGAWRPPRADGYNFERFSDTFLTLAAIAPLLEGALEIEGIAHTRHQECDRVEGMRSELARLVQMVEATEGSLTVAPSLRAIPGLRSGNLPEIQTYHDHRFAMSFGILGSYDLLGDGKPWLKVVDPACCGKTFPQFFEVLGELRERSLGKQ
jgi:3-phosphoshikimate 1-carboxyvinyltransferase